MSIFKLVKLVDPITINVSGDGILNKYDATVAPTANEDTGDGYAVGSVWIDVTANESYICLDSTLGAAIWVKTSLKLDKMILLNM